MKKICLLLFAYILLGENYISAQESKEPIYDTYRKFFKNDYFNVSTLMQFVFDYQNNRSLDGNNGFNVANARLQIKGEFDSRFGYFLQTNFTSSPAILDAYLYYQFKPSLVLRVGQFKAPFSKEFLTGAANIDFVNRSSVVSALVPGRQIGLQLGGVLAENQLNYSISMFNGNSPALNNNDNGKFLYAGRISFLPNSMKNDEGNQLEIGLNSAISNDSDVNIAGGLLPDFSGKRMLFGADVRMNYEKLLLSAEYIRAKLEPDSTVNASPDGLYATVGYLVLPKVQMLLRWEHFDRDKLTVQNRKVDWMIFGINFWSTSITELQLNYIVDMHDSNIRQNQILINAQINF